MNDLTYFAEQVKRTVSCRSLLELAGAHVDRNGFCLCPLHNDHDKSLKVYDNDRGWYCYGCNKGGDVINLQRELYGQGFAQAVRDLNETFELRLPIGRKMTPAERFRINVEIEKRNARLKEEARQNEINERIWEDEFDWWRFLDNRIAECEERMDREDTTPPDMAYYILLREQSRVRLITIEERRIRYRGI